MFDLEPDSRRRKGFFSRVLELFFSFLAKVSKAAKDKERSAGFVHSPRPAFHSFSYLYLVEMTGQAFEF